MEDAKIEREIYLGEEIEAMSDKFVKVATYNQSFEAQLAKNLLENEGIDSMLSGELTADVLPLGQAGSDQIVLQVREDNAQRATGILAAVAAAKLDADWEEQAESGAGVWICSICGEPISNGLSMCYSCQTPREGIRAVRCAIRTRFSRERPLRRRVRKCGNATRTPAPNPRCLPFPLFLSPQPAARMTMRRNPILLLPATTSHAVPYGPPSSDSSSCFCCLSRGITSSVWCFFPVN